MLTRVDHDERDRNHVQQRKVHPHMAWAVKVFAQVAHGIDRAQQRHRQRPAQKESPQRIELEVHRPHRVAPGQLHIGLGAITQHRHHGGPGESGGNALGHDANTRAPSVFDRQHGQ